MCHLKMSLMLWSIVGMLSPTFIASLTSPPQLTSSDDFRNLMKEYWEWKLREFPQYVTMMRLNHNSAAHLDKLSPQNFEQRKLTCEDFLQRAKKMNSSTFSEDDRLNYEIFHEDINTYIRNLKYLKYFTPITFMGGPHLDLEYIATKYAVLKSLNDYQKLLSRYGEFPQQTQEIIDVMKGNLRDGLMPSNWSLVGVTEQLDNLQVSVNESVFYQLFLRLNINITDEEKEALRQLAEQRVQQDLLPSFKKLRDFIEAEYIPAARSEVGVSSLPGGLDFYKACLKFHTTTDLTPQQIHDMGLRELARIKKEVSQTAKELGMPGKTLAEITEILQKDPTQKYSSKEELLAAYRDVIYNTIYPLMDQIFKNIPDGNITITGNKPKVDYACYYGPPMDGSSPAVLSINTKIFDQHKRYEVITVSLHEAIPGHHIRGLNMILNPLVPEFRKYPDYYRYGDMPGKFLMNIAFSEGWGLYSEYLGNELGLYKDLHQKLGSLSYELLRACRLVVDTGLHAFGWTRQEAIDYLLENTDLAEKAVKSQIDRYILWPGEACTYKVGEMKLKELRQKAESELGNLFRVKDFHEVVLRCVGPLNIIEQCVNSYITKNTK